MVGCSGGIIVAVVVVIAGGRRRAAEHAPVAREVDEGQRERAHELRLAAPVREMASSMVYRDPLKKSRFVTIAPTAPPLAVIPDTTPSDLHPPHPATQGVRILYITSNNAPAARACYKLVCS